MHTIVDSWQEPPTAGRVLRAGVGSVIVHILLIGLFVLLANIPTSPLEPELAAGVKRYTPLIAPRDFRLTQKDPTIGKVAKQVRVDDLVPKPEVAPAAKRVFQAPPSNPGPTGQKPAPLPPPPELPKYEAAAKPAQALPPSVIAIAPPQIQPEEKPKLAFETPGQSGTAQTQGGAPRLTIPKPTVEDAIKSVVRSGGGGGGVTVGDAEQIPSLQDSMRRTPVSARQRSQVQLLSDPLGVDFKPYLIQVLTTVKRNWFAVYPESARLGLRGSVALRFVIDRDGKVPHLELAMPSGTTALDRAAVASISASIPFPQLPPEFKGKQIVLQFSFQYN